MTEKHVFVMENLVYGSHELSSIQDLHFIYKKLYFYDQYLEDWKHLGISRKLIFLLC